MKLAVQQNIVMPIYRFMKNKPVVKAFLFGSFAAENESENSDIDILVELEPKVSLWDFAKMQLELEDLLQKKVDLVSTIGLSPYIKPYIEKNKILIYER